MKIETAKGELTAHTPHRNAVSRMKLVVLSHEVRIQELEAKVRALEQDLEARVRWVEREVRSKLGVMR